MARPKNNRANEVLVAALACGATIQSAAQQAGISVSTAYRRLADPEFCLELKNFRAGFVERTTWGLTAAGMECVKTLISLLSPGTPPATRLGAARAGIELGMKVREQYDLEKRLADLEEQMAPSKK